MHHESWKTRINTYTWPEVLPSRLSKGVCIYLHVNDKLWVSIREASKFILVQVHDEEFVSRREFHRLSGELFVEVGGVSLVSLPNGKQTLTQHKKNEAGPRHTSHREADELSWAESAVAPR